MSAENQNDKHFVKSVIFYTFFFEHFVFCLLTRILQDQAKKALESALGGKKIEFEKWDKEIKKREEAGGGGDGGGGGGGGWWRRWFGGGSDGEHFWHEAQQVSLTLLLLAIMVNEKIPSLANIFLYLI